MRTDFTRGLMRAAVALLVSLVLVPLTGGIALAAPLVMGATATYGPLKTTDVNKIWRKVQTNLQTGLNFIADEWEDLEDLENFDVDWSTREIIVPLDINEDAGVASIPEDGYEARPMTPNVEELSLTWILLNKRFTITKTARWIDQRSPKAMVKKQLTYQGMKALQAMGAQWSDYFYGFSTGVLAKTDTDLAASTGDQTLTLYDAYGVSDIDDGTFLVSKFRKNDWVAIFNGSTLLGFGKVTAKNASTPSITVNFTVAPTASTTNGLTIYKANSLENTSSDGTDKDRALVGWLDAMTSASVHGLSNATVTDWDIAYSDTTGGRFNGVKLRRAKDEIQNEGGGTPNMVYMAQGVYRDVLAYQQAALRFNDPFALELDGDIKAKGFKFRKTRRVPPKYVFVGTRQSVKRMTLLPKPGERLPWDMAEKIPDRSGFVFSMDFPCALVWLNRKNFAYFSALTEA